MANASQRRRYRGNCPWFLAMWRGFESVPSSAQHLALSLTIEWYRPEALTTSSTAAPVAFLGQLMPPRLLIVCESPCIRSAHAKNRYFWLRHVGSRFLAKPMPAKNIVTGAMRKRFIRSPHRAGLLFPTYVTTSRPTTPTITTVKALLHHPSFEHLTSPFIVASRRTLAIRFQATTRR